MKQQIQTATLITLVVFGMVLSLYAIYKLAPFFILVLIAIVLTTGIDPLVTRVQQSTARRWRPMPRVLATVLVMACGVLVVAGIMAFLTVTAINESIIFAKETWPGLLDRTVALVDTIAAKYPFLPTPEALLEGIEAQSGALGGYMLTTTKAVFGFFGAIFSLITIVILTGFFTTYKDGITYTLSQFIPPHHQARVLEISHRAAQKMGGWLRGQLLLAMIVMLLIAPAMLLLGVKYAVLIAVIGGIGEMIPMLGPAIAFIPAIIFVIISDGPLWQIFAVIIFFVLLSQAENYLLAPIVMEREVDLSPVTTILALFVGAGLLGVVGAMLAVPVAAAGRVVLLEAVFPAIQGKSRAEIEVNRPAPHHRTPTPTPAPAPPAPKQRDAQPSQKRKRPTAGASQ